MYRRAVYILLVLGLSGFGCLTAPKDSSITNDSINLDSVINAYGEHQEPLIPFTPNSNYQPKHMVADLLLLHNALEEAHTGLFRYQSKAEFQAQINEAIADAHDSLTYLDMFRTVARIMSSIQCAHSGWGHHPDYAGWRNAHMRFFPLDVIMINDRMFVHRNCSEQSVITPHQEIVKINGEPVEDVLRALRPYVIRDGQSGGMHIDEMAPYFKMAYSNFIANPDHFTVTTIDEGSPAYQYVLPPLSRQAIDSIRSLNYEKEPGPGIPLHLKIMDSLSTAIYTIKSFRNEYMNHFRQNFYRFTDSAFAVLDQSEIENLIIDLRGNKGGWTANGKHLFSYFIDARTPYVNSVETKKIGNYTFAPLIKSQPGYLDTFDLRLHHDGKFRWMNYPSLLADPAPEHGFSGNCYVLIDAMSRSCSAVFSALMRAHTNAKFIGTESGGAQCGTNGMVMGIQLPYSGISVHFATAQYHFNVPDTNNARGVEPDHVVLNSMEAFKEGRDVQMDFTLDLIHSSKEE